WKSHEAQSGVILHQVDTDTTPLETEANRPKAHALGYSVHWRRLLHDVGHGHGLTNRRLNPRQFSVYDSILERAFLQEDLPFELDWDLPIVLPGRWLVRPSEQYESWRTYDPASMELSPCTSLEPGDVAGPSLLDGRVFMRRGKQCFLYDARAQTREVLAGGDLPTDTKAVLRTATGLRFLDARQPNLIIAYPRHETDRSVYLGWLHDDLKTIRWFPWSADRRVFGAPDEHSVLFMEERTRMGRLDLRTGRTTIIFPRRAEDSMP
ncbi:MAG: hypothetical protein GY930_21230, partial [bacterium]|nr:hypothetical protein [bacterium]